MPTERLPMRNIREVLRLKLEQNRSHREIGRSLSISCGVVSSVMSRATVKGLDWSHARELNDEQLELLLYGPKCPAGVHRPEPDFATIHTELRRAGVTLELLHIEYKEQYPNGLRYSAFCEHYGRWKKRQRLSMRQVHKAGEKTFVDYSGKKPQIVDRQTGEVTDVELFVAVLGASSLTYAEATLTQQSRDWIASHVRTCDYFGGVSAVIVPDQLKSGVTRSCRYEPGLQRTYRDWARHMDAVVIPARPRKPKDKAKVEVAVQVVQRWVLARIRNQTFFSLNELNERIWELLEDLNARPMKAYGNRSRRQIFEEIERSALKPLPARSFVYGDWVYPRANIDYHVDVERHFYSVPYTLAISRPEMEVWLTATTVEIFNRGERVWTHVRSYKPGLHTTEPEHMPKAHQGHLEWTPSRLIHWAATVGPQTEELARQILQTRRHPEQGYRSCLGIMRLSKRYGTQRMEAAAERATSAGALSYRHLESILKHGMDRIPLQRSRTAARPCIQHDNVRGAAYYTKESTRDAD